MTSRRIWGVLVGLAMMTSIGLVVAMANYHDDKATQSAEVEVGFAVFRYGFIALVVATLAAFVLAMLTKR